MPARPARATVLLLLAALAAAGCQGGQQKAAPTTTSPPEPTTTTTTTLPPTYPLTGRPAADPGKAARAVVSVKIDNAADSRPQAGIAAADVVYEELTEGITRFIVVYHSGDADVVGPVRSVRPADPAVVTPLGGVLAFSGGSDAAVAVARGAPLTVIDEGDTAVMYRRPGRRAPHNLYTSTEGLYSRVPAGTGAPPRFADFLPEGQSFTGPGATPVSRLSIVPARYVTAAYDWDAASGTWLRSTDGVPHLSEEGRIAPTTVIVQLTPYRPFVGDETVLYPEVVGSGDISVYVAGSVVTGKWSKASPEAVTTFADSNGAPLVLPPGQTWVHLLEPGSSVTTG